MLIWLRLEIEYISANGELSLQQDSWKANKAKANLMLILSIKKQQQNNQLPVISAE